MEGTSGKCREEGSGGDEGECWEKQQAEEEQSAALRSLHSSTPLHERRMDGHGTQHERQESSRSGRAERRAGENGTDPVVG